MPILEEALKNFTKEELEINDILKDKDQDLVFGYVLKAQFYKEPTKEEIDAINDIYEDGSTTHVIDINGKKHMFRMIKDEDKRNIKLIIDQEFFGDRKINNEDLRQELVKESNILHTVAASLERIDIENINDLAIPLVSTLPTKMSKELDILRAKALWLGKLPTPIIRSLYDRYTEWESRIFDLIQYESIKKK